MDTPMDRLLALVHKSAVHETAQCPGDCRLVPEVHRHVRMPPLAEDRETLKFLGHHPDEPLGIGTARAAYVGERHVPLPGTKLAVDLQLDGQAMAVIPGH